MTLQQGLAFAIIGAMMALFVWGRLRYDLVAMVSLLAAVLAGIVPYDQAFSGFSDDIVIIVGSALVVSAAVSRSGIVERALRYVGPHLTSVTMQVFALSAAVTVLSAFVKNIGALAMLMPVAFQIARRTGTSPSSLLMPMAFGSLMGGLITLIGTSPNIIVSRLREEMLGAPFNMFDFAPVGIGISIAGVALLTIAWRLLPDRKGTAAMEVAFNIEGYTTEVTVPARSALAGETIGQLEKTGEQEVEVIAVMRKGHRINPSNNVALEEDDIILLRGEPSALENVVKQTGLTLTRHEKTQEMDAPHDDIGVMEAVVTSASPLVDRSPAQVRLFDRYQINLVAVSRAGRRLARRLRSLKLRAGDVIVLQGDLKSLPEALGELRCLPLAERDLQLGRWRSQLAPVLILVVAMGLVAAQVLPVTIAFFAAATVLLLARSLTLREAYETVDWPILIMLGALIPVSESLRTTGGTELIASFLARAADNLPPFGMLALIMVAAMAVTPFLNNAATVLVMGPIAASFARTLGLNPDPFLMAVAIGAACDFLTPIGHQCNTLVMGPGGYRFSDYWKLGLPLSILVIVAGTPLIAFFWPFGRG